MPSHNSIALHDAQCTMHDYSIGFKTEIKWRSIIVYVKFVYI
ncbi:MAG: hypothetical protein WA240_15415 [Nitrospirota bacterium]